MSSTDNQSTNSSMSGDTSILVNNNIDKCCDDILNSYVSNVMGIDITNKSLYDTSNNWINILLLVSNKIKRISDTNNNESILKKRINKNISEDDTESDSDIGENQLKKRKI